jgi:hypothetical protein
MKTKLLLATALLASTTAFAEINTNGLSETQVAELQKQAAEYKEQKNNPSVKITEYADLADRLSQTMVHTAAGLGVAVNDFASTPVGIMTAGTIIYSFIGKSLIKLVIGFLTLAFGSLGLYKFVLSSRNEQILYDKTTKNIFGNYPIVDIQRERVDGDFIGGICVAWIFLVGISAMIMF